MNKDRLARSITIVISSFLAFHLVFVSLVFWHFHLPAKGGRLFLLIIASWHAFLAWALLSRRHLFVLQVNKTLLTRVNVCNVLTIGRLTALPGILYVLLAARHANLTTVLLPYVGVFLATDLLDGQLARRLRQVTTIGRYLDATSDYLVLTGIMFVFLWFQLIPVWFFVLVLVRLLLMSVGNTVVYALGGHFDPQTSFLGKASVFAISVFFGAKLLTNAILGPQNASETLRTVQQVLVILEVTAAAIVVMAIVEKCYLLVGRLSGVLRQRGAEPESEQKIRDGIS